MEQLTPQQELSAFLVEFEQLLRRHPHVGLHHDALDRIWLNHLIHRDVKKLLQLPSDCSEQLI